MDWIVLAFNNHSLEQESVITPDWSPSKQASSLPRVGASLCSESCTGHLATSICFTPD